MFWTRRTGHLSNEDLSAYLDGELRGARLASAERHIGGCGDCGAALDALRETKSLVARLPRLAAPRSFALTPAMAGQAQKRPHPAPRRRQFGFVPVVALTLLIALFAVDLTSSGLSSTSNDEAGPSQAMVAKDASSSAESAAGGAAADSSRQAFGAQVTPQAALPVQPPSTNAPSTGQGITPPTVTVPSSAPAPVPDQQPLPATSPTTQSAPSTSGPLSGSAPAPNVAAAAPDAKTDGGLTSEAAPAPAPSPASANATDNFGDDSGTSRQSTGRSDDGGPDWLRLAEALTAAVFVASLAYLFGPRLFKKGP